MARDDFSMAVKGSLAKRAGFICSNPSCRSATVGPSITSTENAVNIGKAAHITAASPGGARFDTLLTKDQRSGIGNGIWLCSNCADLVDRNEGEDYPSVTLNQWKSSRENEAAQNLGRQPQAEISVLDGVVEATGVGEVTGVHLTKPTRIMPGTHISVFGVGKITGIRN